MNYVFTGPESSGKTTLAKLVAKEKNGLFVPEVAREYLTKTNKEYNQKDLLEIAKQQYELQEKSKSTSQQPICFDTDLITIKIWSEYKYGVCEEWIIDRLYSNKNCFYILCKPDFEWQPDPLRENPNNRDELFELYKKELEYLNLPYQISSGTIEERVAELTRPRSLSF